MPDQFDRPFGGLGGGVAGMTWLNCVEVDTSGISLEQFCFARKRRGVRLTQSPAT